ncbi:DUF4190 domain-containing protein [Streptomyces sp. NBC_01136]|uniref:DUF4190 domain-containing protein n=1 Tax=Streptomyces sp. NBC_01136 TaxID=2903754 RepID=UPI00386EB2C4|nr:DUF4190 domain-containing protein [Streptomyces sp. NBC_01136]
MAIPPPPGPQQPDGPYPPPYPQGPYQGPYQAPYEASGPYQVWGQGYSPYNRPAPVNGLAIAALVLGVLCFLPAVGLVLGIVALAQIRKRGERGKGLAVGGMVMSSLGIALFALALATGGARDFWDGFKDGAGDSAGTAFTLKKGDCFDAPGGSLEGLAYDVDKVPCAGRHDAEVFADFKMSGGSYPGDSKVVDAADSKCYALQDAYAMDAWAVPDNVDVYYFTPTRDSWSGGDRSITCMFGNTDEKSGLKGSLRKDDFTLNAHQFAYLQAAVVLNEAMDSAPEKGYVEDDLPGHKEWATRVSVALDDQARLLRGHGWFPAAEKPIAVLVDDIEASRKEWTKAAAAEDADTFYAHYEKGLKLIDPRRTVTARKVLGLATTPPSSDGGGGNQGDGGDGTGAEV